MLEYRWQNSYKKEKEEPNIPVIGGHNAEWVLFQIGRDVQLSKLIATKIKRNYMQDWLLPASFIDSVKDKPTFQEADLFEIVMDTFLKFLDKHKEEKYKLIDFVNSILKTKIIVEDGEVMISSRNSELIADIKNRAQQESYSFRTL